MKPDKKKAGKSRLFLKQMIKKNDIFIVSVFHKKTAGNGSQTNKSEFFIKMKSRVVCGDNGIELKDFETQFATF